MSARPRIDGRRGRRRVDAFATHPKHESENPAALCSAGLCVCTSKPRFGSTAEERTTRLPRSSAGNHAIPGAVEAPRTSVDDHSLRFRIICERGSQSSFVLRSRLRRRFCLHRGKQARAIDDAVYFETIARSPEIQRRVNCRVGTARHESFAGPAPRTRRHRFLQACRVGRTVAGFERVRRPRSRTSAAAPPVVSPSSGRQVARRKAASRGVWRRSWKRSYALFPLHGLPSSSGVNGWIVRITARPPSRSCPDLRSLRTLEPVRTNRSPSDSTSACTTGSTSGTRCTSSTTTGSPAGAARAMSASRSGYAESCLLVAGSRRSIRTESR